MEKMNMQEIKNEQTTLLTQAAEAEMEQGGEKS